MARVAADGAEAEDRGGQAQVACGRQAHSPAQIHLLLGPSI